MHFWIVFWETSKLVKLITKQDIDYLSDLVGNSFAEGVDNRDAYYSYLEGLGYQYGGLAGGVVREDSYSGLIANAFMAETAVQYGNAITIQTSLEISYDLMSADFNARAALVSRNGFAGELGAIVHYEHHKVVFGNSGYGLDIENWTAAEPIEYFIENYQGLGFDNPSHAANYIFEMMMDSNLLSEMFGLNGAFAGLSVNPHATLSSRQELAEWIAQTNHVLVSNAWYIGTGLGSPYEADSPEISHTERLREQLTRDEDESSWPPEQGWPNQIGEGRNAGAELSERIERGRIESGKINAEDAHWPENKKVQTDPRGDLWSLPKSKSKSTPREDHKKRTEDDPNFVGPQPIVLDLDGNGIRVTELSESKVFMDATGDGFENRTAWAGVGDGVLFYDPDNTGEITETRQYVFTEWDPTASSDLEALRSVFDSNGDGVFDASDAEWLNFKVMVTQADGSLLAQTLAQLGIASIDLTPDATHLELPDGSTITGLTTMTMTDGSVRDVADMVLVAEASGARLEEVESFDGALARTLVQTGYNADGSVAFEYTSVTSADGSAREVSYDDDGDGVVDRLQVTSRVVNQSTGVTVKDVSNYLGAVIATAILISRTVTTASANGKDVTIERDSTGGGWFDQIETRLEHTDGSLTITVEDRANDGTVIQKTDETVSADGLSRTEHIDRDGDGVTDVTITHAIVVNVDGSRTETTTTLNQDGTVRDVAVETKSADGKTKSVAHDLDGDGVTDIVEDSDIIVNTDGTTTSVIERRNPDGSLREKTTWTQSDDALTKTSTRDADGDGDIDLTAVDTTVVHTDGSRDQTVLATNQDGSVRNYEKVSLSADRVSNETWRDLNQDGVFQTTDLISSVTVDGVTGERAQNSWARNADGSVSSHMEQTTSSDGLSATSETDEDGDGTVETTVTDVTLLNGNGTTTQTIEAKNADGSVRSKSVAEVSADGLVRTTYVDENGDGVFDAKQVETRSKLPDGSSSVVTQSYTGDGVTLLSAETTVHSADRLTQTRSVDLGGDGSIDESVVSVEAADGTVTVTTSRFAPDGTLLSDAVESRSANGLVSGTFHDVDGDGLYDVETIATTELLADGSTKTTQVTKNADGSLRSTTTQTVSDNGHDSESLQDSDGDGVVERKATTNVSHTHAGERVETSETFAEDGSLLGATRVTQSGNGLSVTFESDVDGDGTYDGSVETTTTYLANGDTTVVEERRDSAGLLKQSTTRTTDDAGRSDGVERDLNGDGIVDHLETSTVADDGLITQITQSKDTSGGLQNAQKVVTAANGTSSVSSVDGDGDGTFEAETTTLRDRLSDGTVEIAVEMRGTDGSLHSTTTQTSSGNGLSITSAQDIDGDGTDDFRQTRDVTPNADGSRTQIEEAEARDGSLLSRVEKVVSGDGRSTTRSTDLDGDGQTDELYTATLMDTGAQVTTNSRINAAGDSEYARHTLVSGDGRDMRVETDLTGDGIFDRTTLTSSSHGASGLKQTTTIHYDRHFSEIGSVTFTEKHDGTYALALIDRDGDGVTDLRTEFTRSFEADGDITEMRESTTGLGHTLLKDTNTISGNGLDELRELDFDGDGSLDQTRAITRDVDGGSVETWNWINGENYLSFAATRTVSDGGRQSTLEIDQDGDGTVDQRSTRNETSDRDMVRLREDLDDLGDASSRVEETVSANGMVRTQKIDTDGDGTFEIERVWTDSFDATGAKITTFVETFGGREVYTESGTEDPNGLSFTSTFDVDGDGVADGTSSSARIINDDGSETVTQTTSYADGALRTKKVVETSADGREVREVNDYDGNGVADIIVERSVRSDGAVEVTRTSYNEAGYTVGTFSTLTSADGLTSTTNRGSALETFERSELGTGSYTWTLESLQQTLPVEYEASHHIDAAGVRAWTLTETTSGGSVTEHSQVLTSDAFGEILADAVDIYDAALDRDMDTTEREVLVKYVENGRLDGAALADLLANSGEFATRYGSPDNAAFVSQTFLNAFGRAPSMAELDEALGDLINGGVSRGEFIHDLARSSEHDAVGNTHILTNNYDVIMNPAQFERTLDRANVEHVVTSLFDVIYDRAPEATELEQFTKAMLNGDQTAKDIATTLLAKDSASVSSVTNSLHGLTNEQLVSAALANATGAPADPVVHGDWLSNLDTGRIDAAQFVLALAPSIEHLEVGNASTTTGAPVSTLVTGTAGIETLTGTAGHDTLEGLDGIDTLYSYGGADTLIGGTGNDVLWGGEGNDLYIWAKGDGNDQIVDYTSKIGEVDTLRFVDVESYDLAIEHLNGDVRYTILSTGEMLWISNWAGGGYTNHYRGIDQIEFSDGVVWTLQDIEDNAWIDGTSGVDSIYYWHTWSSYMPGNIRGHAGNDELTGDLSDDVLIGGQGNDRLYGYAGDDTYVWTTGDGDDWIYDNGAALADLDRLVLTDVNSDDVKLWRASTEYNMRVKVISTSEEIGIHEQFWYFGEYGYGIESILFADGVIWTLDDIEARMLVEGSSGADSLTTDTYAGETYYGFDGVDNIRTGWGDDTLIGGTGNDSLWGSNGNDTYIWSKGDGNDQIADNTSVLGDVDILRLLDVTADDVSLTHQNGDMRLTVVSTGETLAISNWSLGYTNRQWGIDRIEFAGGVTWTIEDIEANIWIEGTSGNDSLYQWHTWSTHMPGNLRGYAGNDELTGDQADDILDGGTGNDKMWGYAGNDIYLWSTGDGNDDIYDSGSSDFESDSIRFGDVSSQDVVLTQSGTDLLIAMANTSEVITVHNRFSSSSYGVEFLTFTDGVFVEVLDEEVAKTIVTGTLSNDSLYGWGFHDQLEGLAGVDTLYGYGGSDTLIGGTGVDALWGGDGNDLYIWSKGDGNDAIYDYTSGTLETDILRFTDVTSDDVSLAYASTSMEITITSTGEVITVSDWVSNYTARYAGIDQIEFSDGVVWALSDIEDNVWLDGTSGNDSMYQWHTWSTHMPGNLRGYAGDDQLTGDQADDVLIGGIGDDLMYGYAGNDTYEWSKGDGNDWVYDNSTSLTDLDSIVLTDVLSSEVGLHRNSNDYHLRITITTTGEEISVHEQFWYFGEYGYGIEGIEFADGETWTLTDIVAHSKVEGSSGADSLIADTYAGENYFGYDGIDYIRSGNGDDVIVGGAGNDALWGGQGNDTYIWSKGEGSDQIADNTSDQGEVDTLRLLGVTSDDVSLTHQSGDMRLTIVSTGETLAISNWSLDYTSRLWGIDRIEFSGGVVWTLGDIEANIWQIGTSGDDTLSSWHSWSIYMPGNLQGLGGNDTLYGDHGDDTLDGGTGQDYMNGSGGDDLYIVDDLLDVLVEYWNGGIDTVQASVDWTLDTDFEHLILDGTADFDGTGNTKSNHITGNSGDNLIMGLAGADVLDGGDGADTLDGGEDSDQINGGGGDDIVIGGAGDDLLLGGADADVFVFADGSGNDIVRDLEINVLGEAIDFAANSAITDYADLIASHLSQVGTDTVINDLNGNIITLEDIDLTALQSDNFVF